MPTLTINVRGIPAPQGSKRGFPIRRKNGTIGVALTESAGDRVKTWREDVRAATITEIERTGWTQPPLGIGLTLDVVFGLPRPKSHYRTGANAHLLRPNAPRVPTTKPDVDKLSRAIMDALTSAGAYADDSAVISLNAAKTYADGDAPGAFIMLNTVEGATA